MSFTKILMTFFLVVILVVSISNQNVIGSEMKISKTYQCFNQCTSDSGAFGPHRCNKDCMAYGYVDGQCITGLCCCGLNHG
ncbi:hypothetical protein AALP_AA3G039400 [Arabis alpina]|uniref:Defensin-like domain-containing protein n=1 Tax=Arabis alpina TaxID=50452 RepID=A0A087H6W3_ARAAL|nr:hypothetical protein AALP_AA3G039400 [Arabis alpina]